MNKRQILKEARTASYVILFSLIFSLSVVWFLESIDPPLLSVGIPGIAQLFKGMLQQWFLIDVKDYVTGIIIFILNIPIMILGFYGVSKKFMMYSLLSVVIQSLTVALIPRNNFGLTAGLDPFSVAIIAGLIAGIGIGGALRVGASLGGMDIISQYFSLKKGMSVGFISLIINITIAFMGGIIYKDASLITYTGITIIMTTLTTDKIHTAYHFLKVEIITNLSEELIPEILVKLHRGVTIIDVKGGYKKDDKRLIVVAISTYELPLLKTILYESDPNAFVLVQPTRDIYGHFKRKTIV